MALAAVTLAACAGTGTGGDGRTEGGAAPTGAASSPAVAPSDAPPPGPTAAPSGPAEGNAAALAFTGVDLSGTPVDGRSFAGGDVVLWMWAPW